MMGDIGKFDGLEWGRFLRKDVDGHLAFLEVCRPLGPCADNTGFGLQIGNNHWPSVHKSWLPRD